MADKSGLREFVAVVEHGSFTAAADALNVSTSFVSREVKRLEERLNTRLLHRSTRALSLTEMGQVYFERGREIHSLLETLEKDMADLQDHPKGLVRVTSADLYAERYVAPAIAEFTMTYPEVSIELDTSMRSTDLIGDGFDIAIRTGALADSSLIARKVAPRRMIVCGSPAYLAKHGHPDTPDDLNSHNCLVLPSLPWRFKYPDGARATRFTGTWTSDNVRALIAASVRGVGLVWMTDYYMEDELNAGELETVLEDFEVDDVATWIVFPARDHLPTRVRFLIDFLAERLHQDEQLFGTAGKKSGKKDGA